MTTVTYPSGVVGSLPPLPPRKFTLDEYHSMLGAGTLKSGDPCELLEGWIVSKKSRNTPHETSLVLSADAVRDRVPAGGHVRSQSAVTVGDSEPEPDVVVVRGARRDYPIHLPSSGDIALIIEVADSSLQHDRKTKGRIYARATLPVFWIVNTVDGQIEVYTDPTGDIDEPEYRSRTNYRRGENVPLTVGGQTVAQIPAEDLLP